MMQFRLFYYQKAITYVLPVNALLSIFIFPKTDHDHDHRLKNTTVQANSVKLLGFLRAPEVHITQKDKFAR